MYSKISERARLIYIFMLFPSRFEAIFEKMQFLYLLFYDWPF